MGLSIASHKSCPVYGKYHMQILNAHIMKYLVKGSLQKWWVYGKNRLQACLCKSCRKGHSMLLCNSHIKEPVWIYISKSSESCSICHGSSYGNYLVISLSHLFYDGSKYICVICLYSLWNRHSCLYIKRLCSMESGWMSLCRQIAITLFSNYMNQNRSIHTPGFLKFPFHLTDVTAIYRSDVHNPHLFKEHARHKELLDTALGVSDFLYHPLAVDRDVI